MFYKELFQQNHLTSLVKASIMNALEGGTVKISYSKSELDTIFIREDAILPDEAESLTAAREDRARGDILSHEEVWA